MEVCEHMCSQPVSHYYSQMIQTSSESAGLFYALSFSLFFTVLLAECLLSIYTTCILKMKQINPEWNLRNGFQANFRTKYV